MRKTTLLTLLICLNIMLATALLWCALPPRTAQAQGTGLAGNYVAVTGQIQREFDALYLLDLQQRALHVFYFLKGSNELQYAGFRDLERDFRAN